MNLQLINLTNDCLFQVFKTLVFVVCCVFVSCELLSEVFVDKQWEEFKLVHKKIYSMKEEIKRFATILYNIFMTISKFDLKRSTAS